MSDLSYDDINWHFHGEGFSQASPRSHGATHIGLFLRWCYLKGWAGEEQLADEPAAVAAVIAGRVTGTEFIMECCDGKLSPCDLNTEGNRFAEAYYRTRDYARDYGANFTELVYEAAEQDVDWAKFSSMVEHRYKSFTA